MSDRWAVIYCLLKFVYKFLWDYEISTLLLLIVPYSMHCPSMFCTIYACLLWHAVCFLKENVFKFSCFNVWHTWMKYLTPLLAMMLVTVTINLNQLLLQVDVFVNDKALFLWKGNHSFSQNDCYGMFWYFKLKCYIIDNSKWISSC